MFVASGIEFDKYEAAKDEILAQLEAVKRGDFSDEELEAAKKAMASELRSSTDSPGALEEFYLSQTLLGLDYGPADLAALCELVTREDITALARGIELDTVYFLRGGDSEEDGSDDEI